MTRRQKEEWFFRIMIILLITGLMIAYFKTAICQPHRQAVQKALRDIKKPAAYYPQITQMDTDKSRK